MHILTPETYQEDFPGFYKSYIRYLTDEEGYLTQHTTHNDINITVQTHFIEDFNQSAKSYMTDYSNYYIEIEGFDGKIYNCEVSNESYYVISNLPVKLDENTESGTVKLKEHVYTMLNKISCNYFTYISLNFN